MDADHPRNLESFARCFTAPSTNEVFNYENSAFRTFILATALAGCSTSYQKHPPNNSQADAEIVSGVKSGIVVAVDKEIPYGLGLDRAQRKTFVCADHNCKNPAPLEIIERVQADLGLETTVNRDEADYKIVLESFIIKKGQERVQLHKGIEAFIFTPFPANSVSPWLPAERNGRDDADTVGNAGKKLWRFTGPGAIGYDHTNTQLGQLGGQLSGGNPIGFAIGVLALPVVAILSDTSTLNSMLNLSSLEEGLFGTRITFLGNGVGIHRFAYGYAASDKEEDAGVLARAAFDGAMAMAKEIADK